MRAKTMSQRMIIFFTCLMIAEIRAQCVRPSFQNRVLTTDTDHPTYSSGSIVKFKCSVGYEPVDRAASTVITCDGDKWTELKLECQKKSCGSLGDIPHGKYIYAEGIRFGAIARAECNTGYKLIGESTRNCRDAGWDGRNPICEVVKCSGPPEITNGYLEEPAKEEYEYGEAVSYRCHQDFNLLGAETISCSNNGTFSPSPPVCLKVACEEPDVQNGMRTEGKSPPYRYKNWVRYKCNSGYKMDGSDSLTCEAEGWVPFPPKCIQVTCEEPDIQNGIRSEGMSPPYVYKNSVRYKCKSGYKMDGSDYLTCEAGGWDPSPPKCILIPSTSRPPPRTTGATPRDNSSPSPTTTPSSIVKGWAIGTGVGAGIGVLILVTVYFIKRNSRNEHSVKVPTRNEDVEY